jgi:hypothetical protein
MTFNWSSRSQRSSTASSCFACHNREEAEPRRNRNNSSSNHHLRRRSTRISKKVTKLPSLKTSQTTSRSACNASKKGIKNKSSSNQNLQPILFATKLLWRCVSLSCGSGAVDIRMGCLFCACECVTKNQNKKQCAREMKNNHESRIHPVGPIDNTRSREVVSFLVLFVCCDFEAQVGRKGSSTHNINECRLR